MAFAFYGASSRFLLAAQLKPLLPKLFMNWLFENWHAFADWAAAQSAVVQIIIGTALLTLAYAVFVCALTWLTRPPPVLPPSHTKSNG